MSNSNKEYRADGCLIESTPSAAPAIQFASSGGLPERVDLRAMCSPVENQGNVGSCTANAAVGALEYHMRVARMPEVDLSRLYVYYNARRLSRKESEDCGAFISHVMASVMAFGACPERMWPYVEAMWPTEPGAPCYEAGGNLTGVSYARVARDSGMKVALVNGLPVVFGISLPGDMLHREGWETGRIRRPQGAFPPSPHSGHAMLIVGYDDSLQSWLVRNSWGTDYGEGGYVWIDYEVMRAYSHPHEFWTIGAISGRAGLTLIGPSVSQSVNHVRQEAPAQVASYMDATRQAIGTDLERNISRTRQGIRDRLRGPGAGGGY